jgi:hypothetical protein
MMASTAWLSSDSDMLPAAIAGDEAAFDALVGPLIEPCYKLATVMLRNRWWVATLGCAAVVGLACGRAPMPAEAPPNIPTSCASVFKLPPDVLTVPEPLPPIVNLSKAASQDALSWAHGVVQALRVEAWAVANSRDDVLMSGCLGDTRAQAQLFGDETYLIGMARRTNSSIVVTPAVIAKMTLIEVGSAKQAIIAGDQQVPSQYAWLVTTSGPAGVLLVGPNGETKVVIGMRDGERETDFYGGFYTSDSWAGPLWFQQSYFSCVATKGRSLCA